MHICMWSFKLCLLIWKWFNQKCIAFRTDRHHGQHFFWCSSAVWIHQSGPESFHLRLALRCFPTFSEADDWRGALHSNHNHRLKSRQSVIELLSSPQRCSTLSHVFTLTFLHFYCSSFVSALLFDVSCLSTLTLWRYAAKRIAPCWFLLF